MPHNETPASFHPFNELKSDDRKRKTKQRRRGDAERLTHQDAKVSQERATRIGGSTTHVLPEPRAQGISGIGRYDTPPAMEEAMRTKQEASAMSVYEATLKRLVGATGRYEHDTRERNRNIKPNQVYAVRCLDKEGYFRSVMLKKNELMGGYTILISNAVYGEIPEGIGEVSQGWILKNSREMNARITSRDFKAFPYNTGE